MLKQIKISLIFLTFFIILTGFMYPAFITGIAQSIFPHQANGSQIVKDNQITGSKLIGQSFTDPKYFWGRISSTSGYPYNASTSGGSNLGPMNPLLIDQVKARISALKASDPANDDPIPVDLVTSSASGLDPHISIASAYYQAERIARIRGISLGQVKLLIDQNTTHPFLGFIGEASVNVLELNLALDALE
jgi:K+-transporting ATPase ATPase C chain